MGFRSARLGYGVVCLAACLASGCAHKQYFRYGEDAYRSGDNRVALEYLGQAVESKPKYEDAVQLLNRAGPEFFDAELGRARALVGRGDYVNAVAAYDRAQAMALWYSRLPGSPGAPSGIGEERAQAVDQAVERLYQDGLQAVGRNQSKDAAASFRRCLAFHPGYKDAEVRYEEAAYAATRRVSIMPFDAANPADAPQGRSLAIKIAARAQEHNPEFMEFLNQEKLQDILRRQELEMSALVDRSSAMRVGGILGLHAFVYGSITGVIGNDTGWRPFVESNSVEWPVFNEEGKQVGTKTLTATWTRYYRQTSARVSASYEIVEVESTRSQRQPELSAERSDEWTYAVLNAGDNRAVPHRIQAIMGRQPRDPKNVEALTLECLDELADQMALNLVRKFR